MPVSSIQIFCYSGATSVFSKTITLSYCGRGSSASRLNRNFAAVLGWQSLLAVAHSILVVDMK